MNKIRTEEEVKEICIEELERLIQDIKDDKTSTNYSYNMEVINMESHPEGVVKYVSYGIRRNEYIRR